MSTSLGDIVRKPHRFIALCTTHLKRENENIWKHSIAATIFHPVQNVG